MIRNQITRPIRFFSLFLACFLALSMLAGCGTKQKEIPSENPEEKQNSQSNNNTGNEPSDSGDWNWPLSEQKELSFWIIWSSDYKNDPNEIVAVQKAEEATNVHINYVTVNGAEATEKFGLLMASGDYPDILRGAESRYTGGLPKAVEDGVIYDLTEAVPRYMPHYQALRTSIPSLEKDTLTDDGRIIACYSIASKNGEICGELPWDGLALRQDWLDEQNLEVPTTIDDWHEVLTVFKEKYQCEAPLMIGSDNAYDYCNSFLSAYGVLGAFYQVDNVVHYGPLENGYRQWVELFRQWYAEGLIDPNFIANDASTITPFEYIGTGKAGAGACLWGHTADYLKQSGYNQDENFFLVGATAPVLKEGDTPQLGSMMSALTKETLVITKNCKDLELACRWLDYAYTEESMFAYSYGVEGESYIKHEDGSYSLTDEFYQMQQDEGYPTVTDAMYNTYTIGNAAYGLYNWDMYTPLYAESRATEAYVPWSNGQYDLVLPINMTMTDEETTRYGTLYTAIETLVQENTIKYITGTQDMSSYDQFVADLYMYGIEECIALKQAALDRYLAR